MLSLKELADLVGGSVRGDGDSLIRRLATIDQAGEGEITFLANPKYLPLLASTRAGAVIIGTGVEAPEHLNLLVCANPYLAFAKILTRLHVQRPEAKGVMPGATVDPQAQLGENVTLYPGCYVGAGCVIGSNTILYPNTVVYDKVRIGCDCILHAGVIVREECVIGDRVILQPGAVIGSDGFGFAPDGESYFKIPQIGIVVIEDDVEIGANTCIDRAALGVTRIGRGCKFDNLVQVGHNAVIGENTVLAGQAGIAGSARLGRHCTLGGQSAVAGHIKVGDNLTVGGRGGITGDIAGNQIVSGLPAQPHKEWLKTSLILPRLPEMRKELNRLTKEVETLKNLLTKESTK